MAPEEVCMKAVLTLKNAACCIISVFLCVSFVQAAQNKVYKNTALGYQMEYPSDFTTKTMGSATVFSSPSQDKVFAFSPSVNVVSVDLGSSPSDLDQFYQKSKDALERSLGTVKFIEDAKDKLAKADAYRLVYTSRQKKADFKFHQILCIRNKKAYVVTYTALQDQYDKFFKTAQAMIKSFQFTSKE